MAVDGAERDARKVDRPVTKSGRMPADEGDRVLPRNASE